MSKLIDLLKDLDEKNVEFTKEIIEKIKELINDKETDINAFKDDLTALIIAAENGYTEIVKCLLDKGAEPNLKTKFNYTALMLAASHGHTEIVKILVDNDAYLDLIEKDNCTALMLAALYGHTEIVKFLLDKGAEPNLISGNNWTALIVAAKCGYTEIVKLLLNKGANVTLTNKHNLTALELAKKATISTLLQRVADPIKRLNWMKEQITKKLNLLIPKNKKEKKDFYKDIDVKIKELEKITDQTSKEFINAFENAFEKVRKELDNTIDILELIIDNFKTKIIKEKIDEIINLTINVKFTESVKKLIIPNEEDTEKLKITNEDAKKLKNLPAEERFQSYKLKFKNGYSILKNIAQNDLKKAALENYMFVPSVILDTKKFNLPSDTIKYGITEFELGPNSDKIYELFEKIYKSNTEEKRKVLENHAKKGNNKTVKKGNDLSMVIFYKNATNGDNWK